MKKKFLLILLSLVFIAIIAFINFNESGSKISHRFQANDDLQIYFFDAGKADCAILKQDETYIMIDTGDISLNDDLMLFLEKNKIDHLDLLILSHFDKDHIGNAASVIRTLDIQSIYTGNVAKDSQYYDAYIQSIKEKGIQAKQCKNEEVTIGDLSISIEGTSKNYQKNSSNNSSLIVKVEYGQNSFLFTGDIQNDRIKDYLGNLQETCDFLKVPYHGHYQKQLRKLIDIIQPDYAIITSSDEENEDSETISLLKEYDCSYYLTRKGNVLLTSDGNTIKMKQ